MGEVVPRGGAESLMKIIVRESHACKLARRVRELSLCPSACFCEDPLQLKRVTSCCCPVLGAAEGLDVIMAKLGM
jgi:hypothetical protein